MTRVMALQNDTVDLIALRHLGATAGVTEQILDINPGLSSLGPLLPTGTLVALPDQPRPQQQATINLWD